MVLASSIYIYIYRVYVDSHSLDQLALASKRTASHFKNDPVFYLIYVSTAVIINPKSEMTFLS